VPTKVDAHPREKDSHGNNRDQQQLIGQLEPHFEQPSLGPRITIDIRRRVRHRGHDSPSARGMSAQKGIRADLGALRGVSLCLLLTTGFAGPGLLEFSGSGHDRPGEQKGTNRFV
jgi:hypothetical protein